MDHYIVDAMVRALKPVLKDQGQVERILERFWSDKIALVWKVADVHRAANEREVALTRTEAIKVLREMHRYHNPQYGVRWEDISAYIEAFGLGRKLTKAEVKRLVEQDILTIQRRH